MTRKEKILKFMSDPSYIPMRLRDICNVLGVPKFDRSEFEELIFDLESEGEIYKNSKNKYVTIENSGLIKGVFRHNSKGFGFVTDSSGTEFYVSPSDTSGALNNDVVLARLTRQSTLSDRLSECRIIKIISVGEVNIVGTFKQSKYFGFVIPDGKNFSDDIFIPKSSMLNAQNNQKVLVHITKRSDNGKNPEGEIIEVLGYSNEPGVDIYSLIKSYGYTMEFPDKVILNSESFSETMINDEVCEREDFRDSCVFTIDGDDSKDFDDAVSACKTENGYRLFVHIADVTNYVTENSPLDIEARCRGTSVYMPGTVIPMLPEKLSNDLCSLMPGRDRLTLSVIIDFDNSGSVVSHRIIKGVINSKHRLTYNQVDDILNKSVDAISLPDDTIDMIYIMDELSSKLKINRLKKGSIDFDFPEVKIIVDDKLKAVDVCKVSMTSSHKIIEEFMLAANTVVAEEMFWCEMPFVYRVHETPSADKMKAFSKTLSLFGYRLKCKNDNPHPGAFADLLGKIKNTDRYLLLSKIMLRSLMKAKYSHECLGHFGLGFKHYCHFTSPIRRYPDLLIHRIIKEKIEGKLDEKRMRYLFKMVADVAVKSSEAELKAMEAERDADDMKKAEYMSSHINETYSVIISSITSFGIFAETEFGIEGFIALSSLKDDYYEFSSDSLSLCGKHTKKTYSIGDKLFVVLKRVSIPLREIDFEITEGSENDE